MVQGAAFMGDFKADAHLLRIFAENLLIGDNDKTCGIIVIITDLFF